MDLLKRLLKSKGYPNINALSEAELETYRKWENALRGRKITDEEVKTFFDEQLSEIILRLPKCIDGTREDTFLKMKLEFITKIKQFLSVPDYEKMAAEAEIKSIID